MPDLADSFGDKMSDDFLWRDGDLRAMNKLLLKSRGDIEMKMAITLFYSHWEGHFKFCAEQLLSFMSEGVRRKVFKWTEFRPDIRSRILFCGYRRSSISGQNQATFLEYLNALNDSRYSQCLDAKDDVIMVDDNLNTTRADAICRNLGMDSKWFIMKKVIIDERLVSHRNAIAHGSRRLRSGDEMDFSNPDLRDTIDIVHGLIRQTRVEFSNFASIRGFIVK